MELYIRNKWISLRGSSYVRDANENDVYHIQGKFWTFTRKKFIRDLEGKDLYIVRNKFWWLFHRRAFVIDPESKEIVATLTKKIFTLHDHYNIASKYGNIVVRGNILGFDYHIYLNDVEVGHVSRKISLRDSFVLTLNDDVKDVPFYVALVMCVDNITDQQNSESASWSSSN